MSFHKSLSRIGSFTQSCKTHCCIDISDYIAREYIHSVIPCLAIDLLTA